MDWDVFICHAWEDKESFVRPLAKALEAKGLRVWFDELTLTVGDSLRRSIDRGLANSRYGVVILSPHFFAKEWPQKELDGLASREVSGAKVILPVWHNITEDQVRKYSPTLADRIAVSSSRGLEHVVTELLRAMRPHLKEVGDKGREEAEPKAREEAAREQQARWADRLSRAQAATRESREEKWRRDPLSVIAWVAILIWVGLVFLVDNLQLLGRWELPGGVWSIIFIGAGVIVLLEVVGRLVLPEYHQGVTGTLIWGVVLIAIGLGFLVGWQVVWPLALVAIGIAILLGGLLWRR